MARQRLVKPEVFQHEELHRAEMVSGLPVRLAYIGLWTQCDRRGCFAWKPATLKLNVLPFDDVDFEAVLSALESHGFVRSYVVDGKRYGQVPTLPRHQSFNVNEKPNLLIPEPPGDGFRTVSAPLPHGASTPGTGTASSTGTATGTAAARARRDGAPGELTTAQRLVIAANRAITARFGEQPAPLLSAHGKSHRLAVELEEAGIAIDFAERSIARQVEALEQPVRTMAYFRPGIFDDWAHETERVAAAGADPVQPLSPSPRRPRRTALQIVEDQLAQEAAS